MLLLRCLACLSLLVAVALNSDTAQFSAANQSAPITSRPELVLQSGHTLSVEGLAFSPDGLLLASGSADNTVKLWDTKTKREVRTLPRHRTSVKAITFRPDGKWLASGSLDGNIKFSDVASGLEQLNLPGNGSVSSIAFSPDGQSFASGNMDNTIKLWDLASKRELTLSGHSGPISIVAFSADSRWLASGSSDKTVKIWAVATGREVATLSDHTDKISSVAFSADGQWLATAGFDARIKLWKVGVWHEPKFQMSVAYKVIALAFKSDSRTLVSADIHKQIKLHDVLTGKPLGTINNAGNDDVHEVIALAISRDCRVFAASVGDKTIELRDVATGGEVHSLKTHSYGVFATAFSAVGRWLATGGQENTIKLWEAATGRELRTLDPKGGYVNSLSFSPDEKLLASGDLSGKITVWDVANGQLVRSFQGHFVLKGGATRSASVNAVAFSPDGKWIVSGGSDYSVKLWDLATWSEAQPAKKHAAEVNAVAFSSDGKLIASGSADETIRIWEATTGRELRTLSGHKGEVLSVSFSPDKHWIASGGSDRVVRIWDTASGLLLRSLPGHEAEVKTVVFSSDGRWLASGSKDSTIDLWETSTWRLAKKLSGHTSDIRALAFSPDTHWLVSGSEDGSTRLWNATTGEAAATLISLRESSGGFAGEQTDWLIVASNGLFDGSPGAWNQILWRFDQNTLNVRPIEVFFNEFFYPGLLAEILAGTKTPAPRDITQIDRRQPTVMLALADEKLRPGNSVTVRDLAVKILVSEAPPDKDHTTGSGAQDVRLFRNGSLVKVWRYEVLSKGASPVLETTVHVIAGDNQLTAYAFNRDNIKSLDATIQVTGAASLRQPATLHIFALGLNKYANNKYNLNYAVSDAKVFSEVVGREQSVLGHFDRVEIIPLADSEATKANILYVLHSLAGIEQAAPAGAPAQLAKLKAAQPEDAVVFFFAGHGHLDAPRFYMLPHDLGYFGSRRGLTDADYDILATRGISDGELELAFEKVNAGQILFVIDACYSGQVLESEEMRRGPMNSKGLAQLAYEKGIYILAASQSYQTAQEVQRLGHGLLTYALIVEGLKDGRADRAPKDGHVLMQEWLDYAIERVPQTQEEEMRLARGTGRDLAFVEGEEKLDLSKRTLQRPRAFYRRDLPVQLTPIRQPTSR
jgi:WD40 repeat protein